VSVKYATRTAAQQAEGDALAENVGLLSIGGGSLSLESNAKAPQRVLDALSDAVRGTYQVDRQTRRAAMEEGKSTAEGRAWQRNALMLKKRNGIRAGVCGQAVH